MRAVLLFAAFLALIFGPTGCDWSKDGMARLDDLYPYPAEDALELSPEDMVPEPDVVASPEAQGDVGPVAVVGHWVMRMSLEATMDILGGRDLTITNLFLVEIPAGENRMVLTYCDQLTWLDAGGLGETKMPPQTNQALAAIPIELVVDESGVVPAQKSAWTWGIKGMEDPLTDNLPENAEDPLVWDQDDDDHPGVTVQVFEPNGDRYMARRSRWDMKAGLPSADGNWLSGGLDFAIDHVALGATKEILMNVGAIAQNSDRKSLFVLRRVEQGEYDCGELVEEYASIFEDFPR